MFRFPIDVREKRIIWIQTHSMPHLDEAAAMCLVSWFGNADFIRQYCRGEQDGKALTLYLGMNGGIGDEHPVSGKSVKEKGECCATLIASKLNFDDKFQRILDFVKKNDTEGYSQGGGRDVASILNLLHRQNSDRESQLENIEWAINGIWLKYTIDNESDDFTIDRIAKIAKECQSEVEFDVEGWFEKGEKALIQSQIDFESALEEYKAKEKAGEVMFSSVPYQVKNKTYKLKVVALKSDNYKMAAAAKFKKGGGANFVVIQNSKGNISILSRDWPKLSEVASIVRYEEQKANGQIITTDWNELSSAGTVCGAERWYYDTGINALLNGGFTHPEIPATRLSLEEVFVSVYVGLNKNQYFCGCREGKYRNCRSCNFYPWGLSRCKTLRYSLKKDCKAIVV